MNVGKYIDIIDKDTGEVYYTCHSKYGGQATIENAVRYCRRHGYEFVGFDTNSRGNVFMWVVQNEED